MARKRSTVSTRTRFEVFKRDAFTCQYCGGKPPAVVLHVDHVIPVAGGGGNEIDNLVTSCKDCNLGKSDVPLTDRRPAPSADTILDMREAREQLEAYQHYLLEERKQREVYAEHVASEIRSRFSCRLADRHLLDISQFLKHLPFAELLDALDVVERRGLGGTSAWQYFCGVCWTKIKAAQNRVSTYDQMLSSREDAN